MYYFIFKRPDNSYYFKLKGLNYYFTHSIGYTNQYGHEIVLIISVPKTLINHRTPLSLLKYKFKKLIIKVLEYFINKLN